MKKVETRCINFLHLLERLASFWRFWR